MLSLLASAGPAFADDAQATRPRVLYVSSDGSETSSVAMFTVDRQTGALTPLANPIPAGTGALGVVATPDGRFVYVADTDADRVLIYSVGKSGAMTKLDEAQTDGDPFSCDGPMDAPFMRRFRNRPGRVLLRAPERPPDLPGIRSFRGTTPASRCHRTAFVYVITARATPPCPASPYSR
jgi:hypothetical protein